jgi:hypothetical protein
MAAGMRADTIIGYGAKSRPVTFDDVQDAAREVAELLALKLTTGHCAEPSSGNLPATGVVCRNYSAIGRS